MSIHCMRVGDTIIGADMLHTYTVVQKDSPRGRVKARSDDPPRRLKTFKADDLFCVDQDDGLWQETVPESKSRY